MSKFCFFCFFQSSFFFSTSFGGRPKTKKAEYSKKAKATDITEYMIQSNSTRLQRLRFNQSNMESSSNKSSEKHKIRHNWLKFFLLIQKRRNILTNLRFFRQFLEKDSILYWLKRKLVKTQPVQACGVGLDHVLSYVSCFGLFVIFSLFSFWPSTKRPKQLT